MKKLAICLAVALMASPVDACGLLGRLQARRAARMASAASPVAQVTVQRQRVVQRASVAPRAVRSVQSCANGQCQLK